MKKLGYTLLTLVLSIIMIPMVFAKDEVKIESYELVENSKTTTELSDPKIDGLNISFDLSFGNVKDYAKYKIVVTNPTKTDYEITKDVDFDISDYITYSYEFEKDDNIVKANDKLTMYVIVTYSKEVPADKLVDGKYIENNKMAISLASDTSSTSKEENPNTSSNILMICIVGLTIASFSIILFITTKKKRYITTFMLSILLIPTTIFALEKITINVETKVTIEKKYKVYLERYTAIEESKKDQCLPEIHFSRRSTNINNLPVYVIDDVRYVSCRIATEEVHSSGERVSVNDLSYLSIISEKYNQETDTYDELCIFNEENEEYICPKEALVKETYTKVSYDQFYNDDYMNNDKKIMNFEDLDYDNWSEYGSIGFSTPNSFTMPKHDVHLHFYTPAVETAYIT